MDFPLKPSSWGIIDGNQWKRPEDFFRDFNLLNSGRCTRLSARVASLPGCMMLHVQASEQMMNAHDADMHTDM